MPKVVGREREIQQMWRTIRARIGSVFAGSGIGSVFAVHLPGAGSAAFLPFRIGSVFAVHFHVDAHCGSLCPVLLLILT